MIEGFLFSRIVDVKGFLRYGARAKSIANNEEKTMPLALSHQTRIIPLTRNVWNRINPTSKPLIFDLTVYSSPASHDPCSCDGRILYSHELYNRIGSSFADVYALRLLTSPKFLKLFGPPGPYEMAHVRLTSNDDTGFLFEVLQLNSEKVVFAGNTPFDPEDEPIMQWAKLIRDQAFVDRILELGKGYEFCGEQQYQFEIVIELAPGMVFTLDYADKTPYVYVDLERFQNPDEAFFKDMRYVKYKGLMTIHSKKFPITLYDRVVEDFKNQMLAVCGTCVIDPTHHKDPAIYLWQRREDLIPENW